MLPTLKQYDSVIAAKYLMALANKQGIVLNVTKVQKMLFIAYGYFLSKYNHVLLKESPKAWPYGPVFPRTRNKINYGTIISIADNDFLEIANDELVTEVFTDIINKYSGYTASQLSDWSHMKGSPWDKTIKQPGFDWNQQIPDNFITNYFLEVNV
ncbi:MAG: DUF4065 domain-containing protein [Flavobacterium sp.]|nr:DUF4065 domain-containing protein [Flavobacterium sp.]